MPEVSPDEVQHLNDLTRSMAHHPAGKARPSEVVYSTATGEEPRGSLTLTTEATTPLPPPVKLVRKTTTKKRQPRVKVKTPRLDKHLVVLPEVMAKAKEAMRPGERLFIVSPTCVRLVPVR